ncbi:MAG TPA: hypothetical protein VES19_01810 [Candidatus Limnocylindrales bacterium]|nr:hypothetical protein [Candidatus Limnocylindrales bacterium]
MQRQRVIRVAAGFAAAGASAAGYAAATSDELMVGGGIAAAVFAFAGIAAVAVAIANLVPAWSESGRPVAATTGVLLALTAILLVPFTAARSLCACTQVPEDQLPAAESVAGLAPHDLLLGAAVAVPLLLLAAANAGRARRLPAERPPEPLPAERRRSTDAG